MQRLRKRSWMFCLSLLIAHTVALALYTPYTVANERTAGELIVGRVTPNPGKHHADLRIMLDYVVARMGDVGITRGTVRMAKNNRQMISMLRRGEVDWVSETAYSALQFRRDAGAELLLRRWKKGVESYHSVIFVRDDSDIESIEDLVGKRIAFEDPGSTTGFFLPATSIAEAGVSLEELYSPRAGPYSDTLGYAFSKAEINSAAWVHKGIVSAAAFSNLDWNRESSVPRAIRDRLKLIHETKPVPRALEVVRGDLDPAVSDRLRLILLNMASDPIGKQTLAEYQATTRFDAIPDAARQRLDQLQNQITQLETRW